MAIKGGLLDCEGQAENEENFNRIQERYGYEEFVKDVVAERVFGKGLVILQKKDSWLSDYVYKFYNDEPFEFNKVPQGVPLKIVIDPYPIAAPLDEYSVWDKGDVFYTQCIYDADLEAYIVPLSGQYRRIIRTTKFISGYNGESLSSNETYLELSEPASSGIKIQFSSGSAIVNGYTLEDKTIVYPMNSKYLPAAEAVADAAGDTVTGEEFNTLLASLRSAGYLKESE